MFDAIALSPVFSFDDSTQLPAIALSPVFSFDDSTQLPCLKPALPFRHGSSTSSRIGRIIITPIVLPFCPSLFLCFWCRESLSWVKSMTLIKDHFQSALRMEASKFVLVHQQIQKCRDRTHAHLTQCPNSRCHIQMRFIWRII